LIFGGKHPGGEEIQFSSNEVPGVMYGPTPGAETSYIVIYREMILKNSLQELLHQMGQYLARIIPRTSRFKFVQIKSLGSNIAQS